MNATSCTNAFRGYNLTIVQIHCLCSFDIIDHMLLVALHAHVPSSQEER